MASTAWCAWACSSGSGRTAWPRPVLPWISLASLTEIDSAVGAPGQTGMSARPASLRTARVLRVAAASGTLPTTVETPRICASSCAQA